MPWPESGPNLSPIEIRANSAVTSVIDTLWENSYPNISTRINDLDEISLVVSKDTDPDKLKAAREKLDQGGFEDIKIVTE